jgi:hypothetical protein
VLPNPSVELALVIIPSTNLPAPVLIAFVEPVDRVECAHNRFELDVNDAVFV